MDVKEAREIVDRWNFPALNAVARDYDPQYQRAQGVLDGHAQASRAAQEAEEALKEKEKAIAELNEARLEERRWHDRAIEGYQNEKNRKDAELTTKNALIERLTRQINDSLVCVCGFKTCVWGTLSEPNSMQEHFRVCEGKRMREEIERLTKSAPLVLLERIDTLKGELAEERERSGKMAEALNTISASAPCKEGHQSFNSPGQPCDQRIAESALDAYRAPTPPKEPKP